MYICFTQLVSDHWNGILYVATKLGPKMTNMTNCFLFNSAKFVFPTARPDRWPLHCQQQYNPRCAFCHSRAVCKCEDLLSIYLPAARRRCQSCALYNQVFSFKALQEWPQVALAVILILLLAALHAFAIRLPGIGSCLQSIQSGTKLCRAALFLAFDTTGLHTI
jgi:hypothetical protein